MTEYKQRIESLTLIASGGGAFELKVGDELVYSKLDTGEFPDEDAMVAEVGKRL
jgi:selenoprotein W-related protein